MGDKGYHFIGLGGIGMSALASILLDKKVPVTGSDLSENYVVKKLSEKGAHFCLGHKQNNISLDQTVVYTSSIDKENPEIAAAQSLKCRLIHRSDLLKELMEGQKALAVAGTHGKTSVSALLVSVLTKALLDPSYAIGGLLSGENGKWGQGKYFVAEADESDGTFLKYHPFGAIVTNVEKEHMDHYQSEEALHKAFRQFLSQVTSSEHLFYCGDDPHLQQLSQERGVSYGFDKKCQMHILSFCQKEWTIHMDLAFEGKIYRDVQASLVGKMHALNVAAVFGLSLRLGISEENIREALIHYAGVKRRLEKKGEISNILFLDDYAHHPTEVNLTLSAVKEAIGERRLIVLFQPHRYSRTQNLLQEFSSAFERADQVYVTDIYGASEPPICGITAETLVKKISQNGTVPVSYVSRNDYIKLFQNLLRPHDVVVTMGAGDITNFSAPLLAAFTHVKPKKYQLGLVFGGRSAEHEISLRSCRFIQESLNSEYYDIHYFGIDRKGRWVVGEEAQACLLEKSAVDSEQALPMLSEKVTSAINKCDLFFPILHGPNGEDGTIQGFFEMLGKPYGGPDFRSCAITMDKVLTKKLLMSASVPTSKFTSFSYQQWLECGGELLAEIKTLKFPLFVKPARMGSSIGISRVDSFEGLRLAINQAFQYDEVVLVEEAVVNARELEFAVMGNYKGRINVPSPAEKIAQGSFVDYQMKYSDNPVQTSVTPILDAELLKRGKELALRAYEAIGITCMSRVDCLLDAQGNFFFFEINAIPGLTKLSLFPKMWARDGISAEQLSDRIVLFGLARSRSQERHEKTV